MTIKLRTLYGLCGILSAVLFIAADVIGASLRPGYSMTAQAISELVEAGAPNKPLLDGLLLGFHGLVIPFAYGLHRTVGNGTGNPLGPLLLGAAGVLGVILTLFFPCDPGCEPFQTFRGTMHIVIAIPMGFAVLFAILAFSYRLSASGPWAAYAPYSKATFAGGVALAVITVVLAETALVGVFERALTAAYLQWYVVMGAALVRSTE